MFESLSSRLGEVFDRLRKRGALTEADVDAALREVRVALLEADVALPVVRHEQQAGIGLAIRKEILRRRGVIASATVRAPGPKLNRDDHVELDSLIARLDARLRS